VDTGLRTPGAEPVELDHRTAGSIDVTLFWSRRTNGLSVQVIDWAEDEDFTIEVDPASALQAFRHPFAYSPCAAARRTGDPLDTEAATSR
jgi:hypothetical protein